MVVIIIEILYDDSDKWIYLKLIVDMYAYL